MKKLIISTMLLMVALTACSEDEIDVVTIAPDQAVEESAEVVEENVIRGIVIEISEKAVTIQEMNGGFTGGGGMGSMPNADEGTRPEGMPENTGEGERPEGMPENTGEGERPEGVPENAGEGERPEGVPENAGEGMQAEGEIYVYTFIEESVISKDGSEIALTDVTVDNVVELTFNKDNEVESMTILQ